MNSDFCVAVHALVYLNHKKETCSSGQLSENICTNPARIRKVLAVLKKAGILDAAEGAPSGGYRFIADPGTLSLAKVAAALQIKFVEPGWRSGNADMDCLIASGMGPLMDGLFDKLNDGCYLKLKAITIRDLDGLIFKRKKGKIQQEKSHGKR